MNNTKYEFNPCGLYDDQTIPIKDQITCFAVQWNSIAPLLRFLSRLIKRLVKRVNPPC